MAAEGNGKLTIGVPTYNGGKNLPALLESVKLLGLKEDAYEMLIVDNASTDDTDEVIENAKLQYNNIIYYKNSTNIGRIENWNRVLELANGEFLILMNVNDCFLPYDAGKYLSYLKSHNDVALIMNDVLFNNFRYPNWREEAVVDLSTYIRKTFLDIDYLEFYSLGVLQQHIFRMSAIKRNKSKFDVEMPRTTDRVFTAQVIKAGGGKFLYTAQTVVSWESSSTRYHNRVHNSGNKLDFNELWGDEYHANTQVARIADVPYKNILQSQLVLAGFMRIAKALRWVKQLFGKRAITDDETEVSSSHLYYQYLVQQAKSNNVSVNYLSVSLSAFKRALTWYLRSLKVYPKKARTITQ